MPFTTKNVLWGLVWILPGLWIGWLIYQFGVDVPHFDHWNGMAHLFAKADAGTLSVADFFAQHNEHRVFFPRLIMYALALMTHWNIWAELALVWVLAALCVLSVMKTASMTGFRPTQRPWLICAASALVFTPVAWENWLWGFQIGFLFPVACLFAIVWVAPSVRYPFNFILTMLLCVLCTFSVGNGFAYWVLALPLLLFPEGRLRWKDRKVWLLAYAALFLVCTAIYFAGYRKPEALPSLLLIVSHPVQAVQCVLAVSGNPFAFGTALDGFALAQSIGAALMFLFAIVVAALWRARHDATVIARALPWLTLAAYACVNALAITVGRMGIGLANSALAARYTTYSTALPVGLLFLVPLIIEHWQGAVGITPLFQRVRTGVVAITSAFVLLHCLGAAAITGQWKNAQHMRLTEKAVVLCANVIDDPEIVSAYVHPNPAPLKSLIALLEKLDYLRPAPLQSNDLRDIQPSEPVDAIRYGNVEQFGKPAEGKFIMAGWAVLPGKQRAADAVLLTYYDAEGIPRIFAMAPADLPGQDSSAGIEVCGWMKEFPLAAIPGGRGTVRAWAFDAEDRRAYPVNRTINVP